MVLDMVLPVLADIITDPIKKYVLLPIKRHLGYAFYYHIQVDHLKELADQLNGRRERLEQSVDVATRNGDHIHNNVTQWLEDSAKAIQEAHQVIHSKDDAVKKRCFVGLCPSLNTRYQLSKMAEKKASTVDKVLNKQGLDPISYPPPPKQKVASSVYIPEALPSRVSILDEVMEALKDPNLTMIGVHGMGGVGKTTLAKEVHRQAQVDKLFDVVVMVAVSPTPDFCRIQAEIAESLGMKLDEEGTLIRANKLYDRIKKQKVLVILDDIWQQLPLEEVGIPSEDNNSRGCKILLTSRSLNVLQSQMNTQKNFRLEVLPDEEAWSLFEMKVNDAKNQNLPAVAVELAKRCAGLPLFILKVAMDLRNKDSCAWNDKLLQLRELDNKDIQAKIHSVLEKSYENLSTDQLRSFFLLCGLFGQSNIQIKQLLTCSVGLGLFKHRVTMEDVRDGVSTLINDLKADSLLLDGDMAGFVKMHDVIRDTAMSIAWREQRAFIGSNDFEGNGWPDNDCTRISLLYNDIHEFPERLECPKAEFLFLNTERFSPKIHHLFFEKSGKLKVVGFNGLHLESLPSSLASLTNLQTLCLHRCHMDDVGIIGELKQLKVLSFADSKITELPKQIEQLSQLQLLDLSNCSNLEVVPRNALSKLSSLEELYMGGSFVNWETTGNARIGELECLSRLSTLEMQVLDGRILPKNLFLNLNGLHDYKIVIGDTWDWREKNEHSKTLKLKLKSNILEEQGLLKLLKETEGLHLAEAMGIRNLSYDLDRDGFPHLKHLRVENNPVIEHVVDSKKSSSNPAFPILECLFLEELDGLENICQGLLEANSFKKLQVLEVRGCKKLNALFSLCSNDEDGIVRVEAEADDRLDGVVELTHLRSLTLVDLPQLKSLCSESKWAGERGEGEREVKAKTVKEKMIGITSSLFNQMVYLPNLEDLELQFMTCERIWQSNFSGNTSNLTSLNLFRCKNLKYLFTISIVKTLSQLKRLDIFDCHSMEEIICTEESPEEAERIIFFKLNTMNLEDLPKLKTFCSGHPTEFPCLTELYICRCKAVTSFISSGEGTLNNSKMKSLFDGMVGFPNLNRLKSLRISECPKLITVFPANDLSRFHTLERLALSRCGSVVELFQIQKLNVEEINDVVKFNLRHLKMSHLDKLKLIWSEDPQSVYAFQQLQSIKIGYCESLKNLFPASIGKGLLELESLDIEHCGVEEIVGKAEEESSDPNFKFPKLNSLKLSHLPNMKSFYPERHSAEWPNLKCLDVTGCHKAIEMGMSQNGQPPNEAERGPSQHILLFFLEKLISYSEELTLHYQDLMTMQLHQDSLCRLKVLNLTGLTKYSLPFPLHFLERLHNLEKLVVSNAPSEMLFTDETPPQIKHLQVSLSRNLKHIWKQEDRLEPIISASYVHSLQITHCYSLISIVHPSASFQNLATLEVRSCHKLKCLVTASAAKTMKQLKKMTVFDCRNMTEVVRNDADRSVDEILFSKLRILQLKHLHDLASFCSGNCDFNFPMLEEVMINQCNRMEIFSLGVVNAPRLRVVRKDGSPHEQFRQGNLNETIAKLSTQLVDVHHFELSKYSNQLRKNWHGQQLGRGFHTITHLTVDGCAFLTKALSINQLQYLNRLTNLEVRGCESVEVVFDLEGMSSIQGHVGLLPYLTKLHLIDLPMLRDCWNKDPKGIFDLKQLNLLNIQNCSSLRHAFTCSPTALCLENLQEVRLENCQMMEALIKKDEAAEEMLSTVILPSLNSLVLQSLPNIPRFCKGSGDQECPTLKKVTIYQCPKVRTKFYTERRSKREVDFHNTPLFSLKGMSNLEELSLDSQSIRMILQCELPLEFSSKVKAVKLRFFPSKSYFYLFAFLQRLPSLEKLIVKTSSLNHLFQINGSVEGSMISSCRDLINLAPSSLSFNNLTTLRVQKCNKLECMIPLSVAKNLGQLVELSVGRCEMLTEVVGGEASQVLDEIVFSKMKNLQLDDLHFLKGFCFNSSLLEFASLENVSIVGCPNMTLFCSGVLRTPKLHNVQSSRGIEWEGDLNATIQKMHANMVGFDRLIELKLSNFPMLKANWNEQFPFKNLSSLRKLVVDDCASFSNALPSNLLQYLRGSVVLVVKKCDSIEEVFDLEGLDGDESIDVSIKELQLIDLQSLRHVWNKVPEGILSFGSLRLIKIENCGRLDHIFTVSMALSLGNLEHIEVERCSLVEHIVIIEDEEKLCRKTLFPSLESMGLECLQSLSSFYSENDALMCPSLKKVKVVSCPKMNLFARAKVETSMEESLPIDSVISPLFDGKISMPSLDEIFVEWNTLKNVLHQPYQIEFFCRLKALTFKCYPDEFPNFPSDFLEKVPNLEIKLVISDASLHEFHALEGKRPPSLPLLKVLVSSPVAFQTLTALQVSKCHGLINLITVTAARSLVQLKSMDIQDCEMMQEIVALEEDDDHGEIWFRQLRSLTIHGLPSLISFYSGDFAFKFPLLEEVIIRECPNMKAFAKQVMTTSKLWKVQTGEEEYEWDWEGSLNDTIEALFMQLKGKAIGMTSSIMSTSLSSKPSSSS